MEHISKIAFPGFGIGEFELSNVAFDLANVLGFFGIKISSFPVYWYGVIITCGMILAFLYVVYRGKYEGVKSDDITDIALWTVIIGVVGARLYYVLTKIDNFLPKGEFNLFEFLKNVANLRTGGLHFHPYPAHRQCGSQGQHQVHDQQGHHRHDEGRRDHSELRP